MARMWPYTVCTLVWPLFATACDQRDAPRRIRMARREHERAEDDAGAPAHADRIGQEGRSVREHARDERERQTELQFELHELTTKRDACRDIIADAKEAAGTRCAIGLTVKEKLHEGATVSVLDVDYTIRSDITGPLRVSAAAGQALIAFGEGPTHPLGSMLRRAA